MKGEIDSCTIIGDFNTQLSISGRTKKKINKETYYELMRLKRHTQTTTSHNRTYSRVDHVLGHKAISSKFKITEIMQNIFSDLNGMKLEMSNRRKTEK